MPLRLVCLRAEVPPLCGHVCCTRQVSKPPAKPLARLCGRLYRAFGCSAAGFTRQRLQCLQRGVWRDDEEGTTPASPWAAFTGGCLVMMCFQAAVAVVSPPASNIMKHALRVAGAIDDPKQSPSTHVRTYGGTRVNTRPNLHYSAFRQSLQLRPSLSIPCDLCGHPLLSHISLIDIPFSRD